MGTMKTRPALSPSTARKAGPVTLPWISPTSCVAASSSTTRSQANLSDTWTRKAATEIGLREQLRTGRCELNGGAALVQPKPASRDRKIKPGLVFGRRAPPVVEEWPVDLLNVDAAVLNGFHAVRYLKQLAR